MKPTIKTKCVANSYAASDETIAEITGQDGIGCLISVCNLADGTVLVTVYRADDSIILSTRVKNVNNY